MLLPIVCLWNYYYYVIKIQIHLMRQSLSLLDVDDLNLLCLLCYRI
jgi:hypothetical protein